MSSGRPLTTVGKVTYRFTSELWMAPAEAAWFFVTLPFDVADDIEERTAPTRRRGFGSVRVQVTVGSTTWDTSVFPDTKRRSYVLPIKKQVRLAEGIDDGDAVTIALTLVDN